MHLVVFTPQGLELYLDAPRQQEPVLLLDVNFALFEAPFKKGCKQKHLAFLAKNLKNLKLNILFSEIHEIN